MGRRSLPAARRAGSIDLAAIRSLWQSLRAYCAHDDPLVATANLVALVVAWNQPFYPLYIYWSVSPDITPSLWTFLSTPFFLAVPAVSRLNTIAGRVMLPLVGMGNTVLSAKVMGVASGVETFLIPCALLAFVLFRPRERLFAVALAVAALLIYLGLHGSYGEPVHLYTAKEYARFVKLNALSVGTLTVFIGLLVANLIAEAKSGK